MENISNINNNFIKPLNYYITILNYKNFNFYYENIKNYDDLFNRLINFIETLNSKNKLYVSKLNKNNLILNNDFDIS